jgi:two-component system, OmpR family, response regulator
MKAIHVLLVEDDRDMLEDVPAILAPYEIEVDSLPVVPDMQIGELAAKLKARPYDCAILDIRMPPAANMTSDETEGGRLTGVLYCREIRKQQPTLPILVLTAVSDKDAREAMSQEGASVFVNKPVHPNPLAESIRRLVQRR